MEADTGVCKGLSEGEEVCRETSLESAKCEDGKVEKNKNECDGRFGIESGDAIDELVEEECAVRREATVVRMRTTEKVSGAAVHGWGGMGVGALRQRKTLQLRLLMYFFYMMHPVMSVQYPIREQSFYVSHSSPAP